VTAADWGLLIPAVVGCLGALASWLRAQAAHKQIAAIKQQIGPKL
jgi:hypothetical protein